MNIHIVKNLTCIIFSVVTVNTAILSAQGVSKKANLKATNTTQTFTAEDIGKKVPNLRFSNLIGHNEPIIESSKVNEQLLILDFWSTWCIPCIESFPKLEKLQKQYGDKIKILLVNTSEDKEKVNNFLDKREKILEKKLTLPISLSEKFLNEMFPHAGLPFIVILDKNQKLRAIPSSQELTGENIAALLTNDTAKIIPKKQTPQQTDYKPGSILGSNNDKSFYSYLTKGDPKITSLIAVDLKGSKGKALLSIVNFPLINLYRYAYCPTTELSFMPMSKIKFVVKDSAIYNFDFSDINWNDMYIYELTLPEKTNGYTLADFRQIMQQDLKRFVGYSVDYEKRPTMALVLKALDSTKFRSKSDSTRISLTKYELDAQNITTDKLISKITNAYFSKSPYPIIDETNYTGKIDIKINADMSNHLSIDKALRQLGLSLTLEERDIDILVVTEK